MSPMPASQLVPQWTWGRILCQLDIFSFHLFIWESGARYPFKVIWIPPLFLQISKQIFILLSYLRNSSFHFKIFSQFVVSVWSFSFWNQFVQNKIYHFPYHGNYAKQCQLDGDVDLAIRSIRGGHVELKVGCCVFLPNLREFQFKKETDRFG